MLFELKIYLIIVQWQRSRQTLCCGFGGVGLALALMATMLFRFPYNVIQVRHFQLLEKPFSQSIPTAKQDNIDGNVQPKNKRLQIRDGN